MKKIISYLVIIIMLITFTYGAYELVEYGSSYGSASNIIVQNTMELTGAINTVTATVFDFRGYDTLGEAIVLFTAVSGVTVVLRSFKTSKKEEVK